jgi:hypothetical protein
MFRLRDGVGTGLNITSLSWEILHMVLSSQLHLFEGGKNTTIAFEYAIEEQC